MITENGYKKLWIKDDIYTLVDAELYPVLKRWKWSINAHGYLCRHIDYPYTQKIMLHQTIASIKYGNVKDGFVIDHIDRDKLNNTIKNIRICSHAQNNINKNYKCDATSKYIGVCWSKLNQKWRVQIQYEKKRYHIGLYVDEKEAAIARDKKAIELHGRYARLNFPEMFKDQLYA